MTNSSCGWGGLSCRVVVILVSLLLVVLSMHAQDLPVVTNVNQLTDCFSSQPVFAMPSYAIPVRVWMLDEPLWVDLSQLPSEFTVASTNSQQQMFGMLPVFSVDLTRDVLKGTTVVGFEAITNTLNVGATAGYATNTAGSVTTSTLRMWRNWLSWAEPGEIVPAPTLLMRVRLASLDDRPAYSNMLVEADAAYEAEQAEIAARNSEGGFFSRNGGAMMLMSYGSGCTITNESEAFQILYITQDTNSWTMLTWESCTDHIYGVFSVDDLSTNTPAWSPQAAMWGGDGTTSWTDTNSVNIVKRFYKVVRMAAADDFDGDGMPNGWEIDHGLNPMDSGDASGDPDGDGLTNAGEYAAGTDPQNPDSDGDGMSDGNEVALGTNPLDATPSAALAALDGFNYAQVNLLRGLAGLSPTAWNHGASLGTQISTIRGSLADLFSHCLDLTINSGGVLANNKSVVTWTLSTVLTSVGTGPNNWLSGAASTNQVAELAEVLGQLTYLVVSETAQAGHPDALYGLTGTPNRADMFSDSFAYPTNWVPSWGLTTYFHATNNAGYGSSIADDFVKFNGTVIAGNEGWCSPDTNCPSLPTAFTYDVTSLWQTNSSNAVEVWDGGCCGGSNNTAYLAPFQIVHVLQPPVITVTFAEDAACSGFDDWTGFQGALSDRDLRVWLAVPQGGNNTITASMSPISQLSGVLSFDTEDPSVVTVSPLFATAATQGLTVTGTATTADPVDKIVRAKIGIQ